MRSRPRFAGLSQSKTRNGNSAGRPGTRRSGTGSSSTSMRTAPSWPGRPRRLPLDKLPGTRILLHDRGDPARSCSVGSRLFRRGDSIACFLRASCGLMGRSWFGRKSRGPATLRLYYASDIHGSDVCWRKFLNAAKFYEVGALIMGGDLVGKALAPVVASEGGWTIPLGGQERRARTEQEVEEMETLLRQSGFYPLRITRTEF